MGQQVMPQSYTPQQVVPQIQQVQRVQPQQVMANTQTMNIPQNIGMTQTMNQMNMAQQSPLNVQQPNINDLNAQKPRSRPPIRTQNNDMFAQFNAPKQQQQNVGMQQVQTMPIQHQQVNAPSNVMPQQTQSMQRDEEKAMIAPSN